IYANCGLKLTRIFGSQAIDFSQWWLTGFVQHRDLKNTSSKCLFSLLSFDWDRFSAKRGSRSRFVSGKCCERLLVDLSSVFEVISTLSFAGLLFLMSWVTESFGIDVSFGLASVSLLVEASLAFKYRKYLT
ncbi:hypothetical protein AALT52_10165, partial [Ligilactobacillus faecis]